MMTFLSLYDMYLRAWSVFRKRKKVKFKICYNLLFNHQLDFIFEDNLVQYILSGVVMRENQGH